MILHLRHNACLLSIKTGLYIQLGLADDPSMKRQQASTSWFVLLVAFLVYFVLAIIGLRFATYSGIASPIWPATGWAFYMALRFRSRWIAVAIYFASFLANYMGPHSSLQELFSHHWVWKDFVVASTLAIGTYFEVRVGADLFQWFYQRFEESETYRFPGGLILAAIIGSLISAISGSSILLVAEYIPQKVYFDTMTTWWVGDLLGVLTLTPFLTTMQDFNWKAYLQNSKDGQYTKRWSYLRLLLLLAVLGVSYLVFYTSMGVYFLYLQLLLILAGFWFSSAMGYVVGMIFYVVSLTATIQGSGPFSIGTVQVNFIYLQLFFLAVSMTLMMIDVFKKLGSLRWPSLTLLVAWTVSAITFLQFIHREQDLDKLHFQEIVKDGVDEIRKRLEIYESAVRAGGGFAHVYPQMKVSEWSDFIETLKIVEKFPGINGIGFVEFVFRKDFEKSEKEYLQKNQLPIQYHPVPGSTWTQAKELIIRYIEPLDRNRAALGLILSSEEKRRVAADLAIQSRQPTITDEIQLVQDNKKGPEFLYYDPIFDHHGELHGLAYAPFICEKLFNGVLGRLQEQLAVRIRLSTSKPESGYQYQSAVNEKESIAFEESTQIPFGQKFFLVEWGRRQGFQSSHDSTGAWVSAISILFSLLLAVIVTNLQYMRRRAYEMAEEMAEELKRSQASLINASKLSSLGEMAGGIAHEINNPLSIIRSRAQQLERMVKSKSVDEDKLSDLVGNIYKTVDRISKIIAGLRSFSRSGEKDPFVSFPLSELVDHTLEFCRERFANHGVDLIVDPVPPSLIYGRETQLSQVLLNLLNNAFDAVETKEEKWIKVTFDVHETTLHLAVTDSGWGIPKDVVEKMMQPFFTTKELGKGTGLGLSISRGIMSEHRGDLLYNAESRRTQFVMVLPLFLESESRAKYHA